MMTTPLTALTAFILDLDGTLYLGDQPLPGAVEFVRWLGESGRKYLYLTNNSSMDAPAYAAKLERLGFSVTPNQVLTSGAATSRFLRQRRPGLRLFILGTPSLKAEFAANGFTIVDDTPDMVVLGFDKTLTYDRLAAACTYIRNGVPYIATHPDINCPTSNGFVPDAGSIQAAIVASTGVLPQIVIGKPNSLIFGQALSRLGSSQTETAMVGDRLTTDIAGSKRAFLTAILVLSGEAQRADLPSAPAQPDYIFESVAELHRELQGKSLCI